MPLECFVSLVLLSSECCPSDIITYPFMRAVSRSASGTTRCEWRASTKNCLFVALDVFAYVLQCSYGMEMLSCVCSA